MEILIIPWLLYCIPMLFLWYVAYLVITDKRMNSTNVKEDFALLMILSFIPVISLVFSGFCIFSWIGNQIRKD